MRFVVILKQIPDDSIKEEYQDVDQLNDSDKNVIKEALDLRDRYGGTVDVIGFGPLSAEDVMKEALTYGIDNAFLINDPQFADMDISQTAGSLPQGSRNLDHMIWFYVDGRQLMETVPYGFYDILCIGDPIDRVFG